MRLSSPLQSLAYREGANEMDSSMLTLVFLQIFSQCSARWYFAIRPVYDLSNGTQTLTRTQRTLKKVRFCFSITYHSDVTETILFFAKFLKVKVDKKLMVNHGTKVS